MDIYRYTGKQPPDTPGYIRLLVECTHFGRWKLDNQICSSLQLFAVPGFVFA